MTKYNFFLKKNELQNHLDKVKNEKNSGDNSFTQDWLDQLNSSFYESCNVSCRSKGEDDLLLDNSMPPYKKQLYQQKHWFKNFANTDDVNLLPNISANMRLDEDKYMQEAVEAIILDSSTKDETSIDFCLASTINANLSIADLKISRVTELDVSVQFYEKNGERLFRCPFNIKEGCYSVLRLIENCSLKIFLDYISVVDEAGAQVIKIDMDNIICWNSESIDFNSVFVCFVKDPTDKILEYIIKLDKEEDWLTLSQEERLFSFQLFKNMELSRRSKLFPAESTKLNVSLFLENKLEAKTNDSHDVRQNNSSLIGRVLVNYVGHVKLDSAIVNKDKDELKNAIYRAVNSFEFQMQENDRRAAEQKLFFDCQICVYPNEIVGQNIQYLSNLFFCEYKDLLYVARLRKRNLIIIIDKVTDESSYNQNEVVYMCRLMQAMNSVYLDQFYEFVENLLKSENKHEFDLMVFQSLIYINYFFEQVNINENHHHQPESECYGRCYFYLCKNNFHIVPVFEPSCYKQFFEDTGSYYPISIRCDRISSIRCLFSQDEEQVNKYKVIVLLNADEQSDQKYLIEQKFSMHLMTYCLSDVIQLVQLIKNK